MYLTAYQIGFSINFFGYICLSSFLQYFFYYRNGSTVKAIKAWKIQPSQTGSILASTDRFKWWLPLLNNVTQATTPSLHTLSEEGEELKEDEKPMKVAGKKRQPNHFILATVNLILASSFMGATYELATENTIFYQRINWVILNPNEKLETLNYSLTENFLYSLFFDFGCLTFSIMWQCFLEYYWHRLMHTPFCMRNFHKLVSFLL